MAHEATIRLDVRGPIGPHDVRPAGSAERGNARFAAELGEVVATVAARSGVRVVVMTGRGRAFQTGVDLKRRLAAGELTLSDLVRWEDR